MSDLWRRNAEVFSEQLALVDRQHRLTWKEAWQWAERVAGTLSAQFQPGDAVVLQLPPCALLAALRVACEMTGILAVLIPPFFGEAEVTRVVKLTAARGIVRTSPLSLPQIDPVPVVLLPELFHAEGPRGRFCPIPSHVTSFLLPTSGSTGEPKLVEHCVAGRLAQWKANAAALNITSDDSFAVLSPNPGGINMPAYFGAPLVAAATVMLEHFSPRAALELIARERVSVVCAVPAHLTLMLATHRKKRAPKLYVRYWWCAGAPLPEDVALTVESELGGVVVPVYGATDWGGECVSLPGDSPSRLRSVGKPIDGTRIRVVNAQGEDLPPGEVGEVWGCGPNCVSGYFKDPKETARAWTPDGWYRTGDTGYIDEWGNLVLTGRIKELIIRGGQNISPLEIEKHLRKHPRVADVVVMGRPDPVLGERVAACIVPKGPPPTVEDLTRFLDSLGVARFKHPEIVLVLQSIPLLEGGKPDRRTLARLLTEGHQ